MARRLRARAARLLSRAALGLLALASVQCGGDELPRPDGFTLTVTFRAIDPSIISNLNVNLVPQGADEAFMDLVAPLTFNADGTVTDSGPFTYDVADDGALEIDVTGNHVNDNSVDNGDGSFTFELLLWSAVLDCNDEGSDCEFNQEQRARNPAPLVTVIAERAGEPIGDNQLFLTAWPLPTGGSASIEVQCRAGAVGRCTP